MDLKHLLKEKRPNLSKTSINAYASTLSSLHKQLFGEEIDPKNFDNTEKIIKFLKDVEPSKRKSKLASLVVISDKPEYRNLMLEDIKEYNKEQSKQVKSKAQEESWVDTEHVTNKLKELEDRWKQIIKKNRYSITQREFQEMQDYVILALLSGIHIPPRRLKDYIDFRIRESPTEEKYNYKKGGKLIFNSYKTAKTYGQQIVKIPQKLTNILNKWTDLNPTIYLLIDKLGRPLSNVKLNQRINKIFGKKVSCNALRHSYLSHKYKDRIDSEKELKDDFEKMGSSILQEKVYIKE